MSYKSWQYNPDNGTLWAINKKDITHEMELAEQGMAGIQL